MRGSRLICRLGPVASGVLPAWPVRPAGLDLKRMDLQDKDGSGRRRVYLDHNATAPLHPQARAAALACMDGPCNASSIHAQGRAARAVVEKARGEVARLVGAPGRNVVFTSGATEALALALQPDMELAGKPVHCDILLASAVEHPAVLRGHRFADMETIAVDASGRLVPDALEEALKRHAAAGRRALVAIMAANNETGVLQPVAEAARLAHRHGAVVLCDAVQAAGRVNLDIKALDVDFLALSAHKIGGLQGQARLFLPRPPTVCRRFWPVAGRRGAARRHRECARDRRFRRGGKTGS